MRGVLLREESDRSLRNGMSFRIDKLITLIMMKLYSAIHTLTPNVYLSNMQSKINLHAPETKKFSGEISHQTIIKV